MRILTGEALQAQERADGWAHLVRKLTQMRDHCRTEADRLLGPERGE